MRRVVVMVRFAKNLPASEDEDTVSFGEADELKEAVVFYDDKLSDVAILKVKDMDEQYDLCKFGRVENLHIGMDVFTIMPCPTKLEFTFTQGYVGFPNRSYRDVVTGTDCKKCDDNLPLIQIHGLNNLSGSSGSPVFDSMGRVIGMFILSNRGIDFAIHIRKLREICQCVIPTSGSGSSSSNTTHVEKKKRKRKKAGPSH
ncbi:putative serine protease HtrA [Camellia lanceoleosa]|uniref:Serine protease HtrA n=1 Tax=Camellia lanceoleosa TaxID=1840588 RepID=A0ACC0FWB9_9ERIC|nr:putative serine protease HtrA [Camellia lanceoleosa]